MRWNATRRPPASTTAALTLMLSCFALAIVASRTRLASSSVRAIDLLPSHELVNPSEDPTIAAGVRRSNAIGARGGNGAENPAFIFGTHADRSAVMSDFTRLRLIWEPRMLSISRIMIGLLFMEHGTAKVLDFPHQETHKIFDLLTLNPGAQGLIELIGGFLFAVGPFTHPVAFIP